tara:strand:+ start:304 stop:507 length:204 start_codon:yes stop_codon:yes gene_type:complete
MEDIYLLFEGTSEDGRGFPAFQKRTTSAQEAKAHYEKCDGNVYSNGKVMILKETSFEAVSPWNLITQ